MPLASQISDFPSCNMISHQIEAAITTALATFDSGRKQAELVGRRLTTCTGDNNSSERRSGKEQGQLTDYSIEDLENNYAAQSKLECVALSALEKYR